MDDAIFGHLLDGASKMASAGEPDTADSVLEALQRAVDEQAKILHRQSQLIRRLRTELNGVEQNDKR